MKKFKLFPTTQALKLFLIVTFFISTSQAFGQAGLQNCWADKDGDGFGDPNDVTLIDITFGVRCGTTSGVQRVDNNLDCDDADRTAFPGQVWYKDIDDDNLTTGETLTQCLRPFGYKTLGELASREPVCNFVRNGTRIIDCDGFVKNDLNTGGFKFWFIDNDGDGFIADKEHYIYSCTNPIILLNNPLPIATNYIGFTTEAELCNLIADCNDNNNIEYPGQNWYLDSDHDGYPLNNTPEIIDRCLRPFSAYVSREELKSLVEDCDDTDPKVIPRKWYKDQDGDGYTDGTTLVTCGIQPQPQPLGYILSPQLFLGAPMIDCDDSKAEVLANQKWFTDPDNDGYLSAGVINILEQCTKPAGNWISLIKLLETGAAFFASATNIQFLFDCNANDPLERPNQSWYPDTDGDGYPGSTVAVVQCSRPTGHKVASELLSAVDVDCNDQEWLEGPNQVWYPDFDNDGYPTLSIVTQCRRPSLLYKAKSELKSILSLDCNDNDKTINPETVWYFDKDKDGYQGTSIVSCSQPGLGYTTTTLGLDCNDNDAAINPATLWVLDADRDGYKDKLYFADPRGSCTPPQDGRHYINNSKGADCDDQDPTYTPETVWVMDADGDGYYTGQPYTGCILFGGSGYVRKTNQQPGDCNDNDNTTNIASFWLLDADKDGYHQKDYFVQFPSCTPPDDGRNYINNSKGQDCNDSDPTYTPETVWVMDADGDGYYTGEPYTGCFFIFTPGYVRKTNQQSGDCDDNNKAINPATNWFRDADGDGYSDGQTSVGCTRPLNFKLSTELAFSSIDCRDDIKAINPGATEICDGIDNDCDGLTDEGVTTTFYLDKDGDGFGNASVKTQACSAPSGYVADSRDCDDNNKAVNPNTVWIVDADADGYYPGTTLVRCTSPGAGYIIRSTQLPGDCLDNNASVNPAAVEVCGNRIDDNCNGFVDEAICSPCQNATNLQTTNITATGAQLNWTAVANPVQWQVQYKTTRQSSKWVDVFVTGNRRLVVLPGLTDNQNYQWQIRARCGNNWTSYSNAASFTTGTTNLMSRAAVSEITEETVAKPGVRVYPNPSRGQFTLEMQLPEKNNSIVNIQVTDLTGRVLQTETAIPVQGYLQKNMILKAALAKGMYTLRIVTGNKTYNATILLVK